MPQETGSQYIARCRKLGFNDNEITQAMQKIGWNSSDLQHAFAEANQEQKTTGTKKGKKSNLLLWIIVGVIVFVFLALGGLLGYLFFFTDTFAQEPAATDFTYNALSIIIG